MPKNLIAGAIPAGVLDMHVIVLGKTRSGKSSKLRLIAEYCLEQGQPVGIIDPKGDWWGIKLAGSGKSAGFPVVIFGGEHADVKINEHSGAMVAELVCAGNRPFLIDLGGWMPGKRTKFFVDFASTFFLKTKGKRVLMIDEVHNFAPQGKVFDPESGKALHWANRLASEGGGKGVTLISASQRPQKVAKDYVTSHETLIACKVIHKLDRDAVKDWIDGCGDPEQGKEVFKTLGNLQKPEAWVWSPEIQFGPKLVTFPLFRTYDSFKPQEAGDAARLKGWASVDLVEVNEKMAAVIKQEEANDPVKLRADLAKANATIVLLERKATAAPMALATAPADLDAADKRGFERATKEAAEAAKKLLEEAVADIERDIEPLAAALRDAIHEFRTKTAERLKNLVRARQAVKPIYAPQPRAATAITPPPRSIAVTAPREDPGPRVTDDNLSAPQQNILNALAWAESLGQTDSPREMVAFLSGASANASGYQNNLGTLRTAGLISYPSAGQVALTDDGRARAQAPAEALTHEAIMEKIGAKLNGPQMNIVRAAAANYPNDASKEEIAQAAGASPNASGYQNNLGRLRTLGLITYPSAGRVRAADRLFP